jgi:beta-alanine degradation protein BauB
VLRTPASLIVALGCIAAASAQDHAAHHDPSASATAGPAHAELVLDNAAVTVIRIRMTPHEKTPMHDLSARVVIWLTDARLRDTLAGGETRDAQTRAGDVEWVPAQRHAGENLGDQQIEFIAVVPKTSRPDH